MPQRGIEPLQCEPHSLLGLPDALLVEVMASCTSSLPALRTTCKALNQLAIGLSEELSVDLRVLGPQLVVLQASREQQGRSCCCPSMLGPWLSAGAQCSYFAWRPGAAACSPAPFWFFFQLLASSVGRLAPRQRS